MEQLKPCPFCGGEAYIYSFPVSVSTTGYAYYVKCKTCYAEYNFPQETKMEAVADWNRRAEDGTAKAD